MDLPLEKVSKITSASLTISSCRWYSMQGPIQLSRYFTGFPQQKMSYCSGKTSIHVIQIYILYLKLTFFIKKGYLYHVTMLFFCGVASPVSGFRGRSEIYHTVIPNLSHATSCKNYTHRLRTLKMAAVSTSGKVSLRCFCGGFNENLENKYQKRWYNYSSRFISCHFAKYFGKYFI